jgi:hypothetical protein
VAGAELLGLVAPARRANLPQLPRRSHGQGGPAPARVREATTPGRVTPVRIAGPDRCGPVRFRVGS